MPIPDQLSWNLLFNRSRDSYAHLNWRNCSREKVSRHILLGGLSSCSEKGSSTLAWIPMASTELPFFLTLANLVSILFMTKRILPTHADKALRTV